MIATGQRMNKKVNWSTSLACGVGKAPGHLQALHTKAEFRQCLIPWCLGGLGVRYELHLMPVIPWLDLLG
jgi:hypothetical protein